jgi:ABC-type uncharacterized transport system ATPase subunit
VTGPDQSGSPLVSLQGIVKRFGTFVANDAISLDLAKGEIHALLGENGAGKSTLVKILYGLLEPSEGTILFEGRPVELANPEAARSLGIGMVFQHFSLFENLTVADNIALVLPQSERLDSLPARIAGIAERYGIELEATRPVWTLSAGERQRIEIARCLLQDPKLLILDEPTSVLTPQEADRLFVTLERLRGEGRALLYISHRLDEVKRLCDRATILRMGKVVATCDPRQESARSLAALMVGAQVKEVKPAPAHPAGAERLVVQDLTMPSPQMHGTALADISFSVRGGEVFGIAGIAGNGQSELFAALSGEEKADAAQRILIDAAPLGAKGITARRRCRAAFVPEERNGHAAAPDFTLSENTILSRNATGGLIQMGFLLRKAARLLSNQIVTTFDVRKAGADPLARTLSGGNLQKFVVGREMLREPAVFVVNQPTWGVDAAASAAIRQAIVDLSARGAAIVVISQDLDELFEIADRIAVLHDGRLSKSRPVRELSREEIGLLMGGAQSHAH